MSRILSSGCACETWSGDMNHHDNRYTSRHFIRELEKTLSLSLSLSRRNLLAGFLAGVAGDLGAAETALVVEVFLISTLGVSSSESESARWAKRFYVKRQGRKGTAGVSSLDLRFN